MEGERKIKKIEERERRVKQHLRQGWRVRER